MQLTTLPPELLAAIISYLDFRSVLRCRQVCHLLKIMVGDDVCAQYKIELGLAGMEDGPPSTLTPSDRLAILRQRQRAWRALQWSAVDEISMLRGGVWELYGGVLAQAEGKRTLVFHQLPSVIRGIPAKQWKIDTDMDVRDFGMDPAQDLLVIVEEHTENSEFHCRVHLRSIATGQPHRLAPKAGILVPLSNVGHYSYSIQLCVDHLGILVDTDEDVITQLFVWNWKTGARRLHVKFSEVPSFAFLTSSHVMLCVYPAIHMLQAPVMGVDEAQLVIVDLDAASDEPVHFADLDYLCKFHYPALAEPNIIIHMSLRSDPGPDWPPHTSLKVPFHVARQDRLFVITIWVMRDNGNMHLAMLSLVLASTLLSKLSTLAPGERRRDFAWDEWGPDGSRLLPAPATHTTVWVCYVFGTTFVMALRKGSKQTIVTLDFNQLDVRRSRSGESERETLVVDPAGTHQGSLFKEAVVTRLPYWRRQTQLLGGQVTEGEGHFSAVMISEDSLIMVFNQSHMRKYRVLTF